MDTNGAGDAFVGGFLAALAKGKDIEARWLLGCCGALVLGPPRILEDCEAREAEKHCESQHGATTNRRTTFSTYRNTMKPS